jgi:hypothetical protein
MTSPVRFDRFHGKGAFDRLRSMLDDPACAYQEIGNKFGLTRQYIAQLANELGINGRQRQRERLSRRQPRIIKQFNEYPSDIRAVINKLRRASLRVTPYNSPQPSVPKISANVTKNGTRERRHFARSKSDRLSNSGPNGREYPRLDVGRDIRRGRSYCLRSAEAAQ